MLFNKLTEKDHNLMSSYLDRYAENYNSRAYTNNQVSLADRFRVWDESKSEYLYRLLDEQFILEKKVEYTESADQLSLKLSRAMGRNEAMYDFRSVYTQWYNHLPFDYWSTEYSVLSSLINCDCLAKETLGGYYGLDQYLPYDIDFGDGHKMRFEKTTKPMRALGKLVKMFNLDAAAFEQFRLEHSRILNTKKITGTLCLSIHPMDYMTMSMNAENWTSCMNWGEPGSYRGGTIEVMNSQSTIVAYLKSDSNTLKWFQDGEQEWNSKKWRLLITITPEGIFSIKSYPYRHEILAKTVVEWVRELAAKNLNWFYTSVENVPCEAATLCKDTNIWYSVLMREGRMMYCDWGYDVHYGCFNCNDTADEENAEANPKRLFIEYCGPMTCMCCGQETTSFYDESYVYCDRCCPYGEEEGSYCERCGCWVPEEEGYYVEGECYCCDCIDDVADCCKIDGEYFYHETLEHVYLAREKDHPNTDCDRCTTVHRDYCTARYGCYIPADWVNIKNFRRTEDDVWYINRDDVTTYGFGRLFGLYSSSEIGAYFNSSSD